MVQVYVVMRLWVQAQLESVALVPFFYKKLVQIVPFSALGVRELDKQRQDLRLSFGLGLGLGLYVINKPHVNDVWSKPLQFVNSTAVLGLTNAEIVH